MASTTGRKVDPNDPNVRRLVYNMYRGMLGNYNDKANDIIGALPKEMVREDQGIARQLESMIRQSSQLSGGGSTPSPGPPSADGVTTNNSAPTFAAPPPPPPPPPPVSGPLPPKRLSSEIPERKGGYEPPAAIQNAMMTKDKKPFTYTPGGLDLSQIRSPRMQRRITRNANSEGVGDHPQVEGRNEPVHPPQAAQAQTQHMASGQPQTRIIPIQIEGSANVMNNTQQQQQQRKPGPVYVHNKFNPTSPQSSPLSPTAYNQNAGNNSPSEQNPRQYQQQQSWGPPGGNGAPIQSRSFRVLQKITDTDNPESDSDLPVQEYGPPSSGGSQWNNLSQGIPVQQMRKLQLSEDDRALMNKFKAQVDEDSFLHTESDPRYRGAAIPSRAFRMLQTMTDGSGDYGDQVPRGPAMTRGPQTGPITVQQNSSADGAQQPYVPPSEQQVPEPRKYTGGAIPSRSFRMLQAMTAPENCGPGESDM